LAGIVLAAMVLMMKSSILIEIEENGGTTSAATRSEKSKGDDSSVAHDEEAGETSIHYEDNPMHITSASSGVEARPLREWLANHLPSLDAPSIFAVHQAFENDGIKTFNDLVDCVKGRVIDISEIKNYTRVGKLSKMDTLAIIKAIEEVASTSATSQDTALSASVCSRRESIQAVTGSGNIVSNNPMHADNAQILKAINIQTQEMNAQTKAMNAQSLAVNAQSQAMTKAIIEGQQKTSHDLAVNLAKILKEEKA
jgi:hypothetical protein